MIYNQGSAVFRRFLIPALDLETRRNWACVRILSGRRIVNTLVAVIKRVQGAAWLRLQENLALYCRFVQVNWLGNTVPDRMAHPAAYSAAVLAYDEAPSRKYFVHLRSTAQLHIAMAQDREATSYISFYLAHPLQGVPMKPSTQSGLCEDWYGDAKLVAYMLAEGERVMSTFHEHNLKKWYVETWARLLLKFGRRAHQAEDRAPLLGTAHPDYW